MVLSTLWHFVILKCVNASVVNANFGTMLSATREEGRKRGRTKRETENQMPKQRKKHCILQLMTFVLRFLAFCTLRLRAVVVVVMAANSFLVYFSTLLLVLLRDSKFVSFSRNSNLLLCAIFSFIFGAVDATTNFAVHPYNSSNRQRAHNTKLASPELTQFNSCE